MIGIQDLIVRYQQHDRRKHLGHKDKCQERVLTLELESCDSVPGQAGDQDRYKNREQRDQKRVPEVIQERVAGPHRLIGTDCNLLRDPPWRDLESLNFRLQGSRHHPQNRNQDKKGPDDTD